MRIPHTAAAATELGTLDAPAWRKAPRLRIELIATPLAMQPSPFIVNTWRDRPYGNTGSLAFSALHNGDLLALRLDWADPDADLGQGDNDRFADGAAVMFPLKDDAPLFLMGSPEQPVSIWHWRADRATTARGNVASGLGTSRVTRNVEIATSAQHRDGRWQLIFLRKLAAGDARRSAQFARGATARIAFAVWQGGNGERAGLKSVSPQWHDIVLD